ncbi:MAG: hypothetical protein JKY27_08270 [Magnetovibrio sp.]|nr:hypothetical protein [Magnetovibrio sp.]
MTDAVVDTIRQELEKAANLISGARRLMAEGRHVDLSAMEERVRTITQAVQAAPSEVALSYKEHLGALLGALDVLEQELEAHHKALQTGLSSIKHREAHSAYDPNKK